MNFLNKAMEYSDEAIKMLCDVLRFKTVLDNFEPTSDAPFGLENKMCLEYILQKAKQDGFAITNTKNYAGDIKIGDGEELLGILGHLDVVPATGKWNHDPFDPITIDGKIYARGAIDDKGAVVASYFALKMIKDLNYKLNKEVKLILGCDEESGSRCLKEYFKTEKMPDLGFSPDADFPLIYGEKGHCFIKVGGKLSNSIIKSIQSGIRTNLVPDVCETILTINLKEEFLSFLNKTGNHGEIKDDVYIVYGISSHAMHPQKGLNAFYVMMEFLYEYDKSNFVSFINEYLIYDNFGNKLNINIYDKDMKELTQNCGVINVYDESITMMIDLRVPLDSHECIVKHAYQKAIEKYNLIMDNFNYQNVHYVDPNSYLVKGLMESYKKYTNDTTNEAFTIGGGTYAKFIHNAVAFGPLMPGREDVVHQVNEYILIDDFIKCIAIYAEAIYRLAVCD